MIRESDKDTYLRCQYTCVYCGFDGRSFDAWMQLTIDHVVPRHCGGGDEPRNRVAACGACNSMTCRMTFSVDDPIDHVLEQKRQYVAKSRDGYHKYWLENVAPNSLERTLATTLGSDTAASAKAPL